MCRVYGVSADSTTALMTLAKEIKSRGWWMSYTDVVYIGQEEAAAFLRAVTR